MQTEGVHPEAVGVDGVADSDVPRNAFVEAEVREDAEGAGEGPFDVGSGGEGGGEFRSTEHGHRFSVRLEGGGGAESVFRGGWDGSFLDGDLNGGGGRRRWWGGHGWIDRLGRRRSISVWEQ